MNAKQQKDKTSQEEALRTNADWQGVDKDPEEEKGKAEKATNDDLKGKKVDADPGEENRKQ